MVDWNLQGINSELTGDFDTCDNCKVSGDIYIRSGNGIQCAACGHTIVDEEDEG